MKVLSKTGNDTIATVYIAEMDNGKLVEFVESVQPPIPREKKWVLIISTLYGCPVGCRICDAGEDYQGKISKSDMFSQIDYLITRRYPDRRVPAAKFKIQFARMGEPALNREVLDVLKELPVRYHAPGLMPALSTIAPKGTERFFQGLLDIKKELYNDRFQLQFSIHSTDESKRDWLMPVSKWSLEKIANYGESFFYKASRKITLNFALAVGVPVDPQVLLAHFDPEIFFIKVTPVNPTFRANRNAIASYILPEKGTYEIIDGLRDAGYEVILSIGELEENLIGSNCGQHIMNYLEKKEPIEGGYTYRMEEVSVSDKIPC